MVGYLLYAVFRSYSPSEARRSLVSIVAGLITLITLGLFFSLVATSSLVPIGERPTIVILVVLNTLGIVGLGFDLGGINNEESQEQELASIDPVQDR